MANGQRSSLANRESNPYDLGAVEVTIFSMEHSYRQLSTLIFMIQCSAFMGHTINIFYLFFGVNLRSKLIHHLITFGLYSCQCDIVFVYIGNIVFVLQDKYLWHCSVLLRHGCHTSSL